MIHMLKVAVINLILLVICRETTGGMNRIVFKYFDFYNRSLLDQRE